MRSLRTYALLSMTGVATLAAGCGDDDAPAACTEGTATGCQAGTVCEPVVGGTAACFAPLEIRGRVLDAATSAGIANATIVALDVNGSARSDVARSAADGSYVLPVSAQRDAAGVPQPGSVTLRASAAGYQTFPTPPRTALPIMLETATAGGGGLVIMNASTDIALLPAAGTAGRGSIEGTVDAADPGGVLVLAVQGTTAVSSAVSDRDGDFILFDVPPGATSVQGYRSGLRVTPVDVTATSGAVTGVVLQTATDGLATVSGNVQLVNAPGGSMTSVILTVESTFIASAARGEAPAGLRAFPVTGAFSIPGVPPGRYVVLAAFENDDLVRDPDTGIGGTALVHVEVPAGGGDVTIPESFKVTGALAVVSPGASTIEVISTTSPVFTWADDSSEDGYELYVFDAFGTLAYMDLGVARVSGGTTVSATWSGAPLVEGMIYQFRAYSWRDRTGGRTYISGTEDLRGVFQYRAGG